MEKIKVGKDEQLYEIECIQPESTNVLRIEFAGPIPVTWGDITTYTIGGQLGGVITGYETVWKQEENTVWLSNDGSVYIPPIPPEPVEPPEPYVPTLAEVRAAKKAEMYAACEQIIYHGINVTLSDGAVEHYSLTEHDQLNLFGKQIQVAAGQEQIEYHADGQPCRYYTAADMQAIIQAAMWHVSYHTTYCNALNMWIAGSQTADEVAQIFYGADVPEEYQSEVLKTYLTQIAGQIGVSTDGTQTER